MADFQTTLITAIVASVLSVLGFLGLTLVLALYWSNIARRIAPNRFPEPLSEKSSWPSPRGSAGADSASPGSSPASSQRSSRIVDDPVLPRAVIRG